MCIQHTERGAFMVQTYLGTGNGDPEDDETTAIDLIADTLMAVAGKDGEKADTIVRMALMHYREEINL